MPKFKITCEHVRLMPIISAVGPKFTSFVVVPGKNGSYLKRRDGTYVTLSNFLPQPNHCFIILVSGVDKNIFFECAYLFINKTVLFLRRNKKTVTLNGWIDIRHILPMEHLVSLTAM